RSRAARRRRATTAIRAPSSARAGVATSRARSTPAACADVLHQHRRGDRSDALEGEYQRKALAHLEWLPQVDQHEVIADRPELELHAGPYLERRDRAHRHHAAALRHLMQDDAGRDRRRRAQQALGTVARVVDGEEYEPGLRSRRRGPRDGLIDGEGIELVL